MALVSMRQLLDHAAENSYGLPAFNVNNLEQMRAIMEAADQVNAPVIVQASAGARKYAGAPFLRHLILAAVEEFPHIPVVMHQDHGASPDVCQRSIQLGFSSVMMDGSLMEDGKILIKKPVPKSFAVREVGESYKKGEILIKKGATIGYAETALLAELGIFNVSVFVRPRVAVLATGSEIKDLGEPLENAAQIHSSNHVGIAAMVRKMGGEPVLCEIVRDRAELVKDAISRALKSADVLVTTGGISMGDYDFVKGALGENFDIIIDGAAIKPGRHIKVAKAGEKYIFALPGFPYSAMVMCVLYVRVLLNAWFGASEPKITAIMDEDYKKRSPFLEFTAVNLENRDGKIYVNLDGKKMGSSAIVNNLTNDAALLIIPKETEFIAKGEIVEVLKMV